MRPFPITPCSPDGMSGGGNHDPERFAGIRRDYAPADVEKLAGSFRVRHTYAEMGARRLWNLLKTEPYVHTLGALTGNQAVQQVKAGLKAIYMSGWQVAADANTAGQMYPDQSLYPVDSVPNVVRRINAALRRCDQISRQEGETGGKEAGTYWMAPIVADAEAGFGGALNAYELMRAMIEAGAAGVHFEDQLASEKKCGHLGGKVLIPISQHIRTLNAARLAADVEGVSTVLLCRTDSHSAQLLIADVDARDRPFLTGERTPEGFHRIKPGVGVDYAIARGLAFAPYADLLWWETSEPNLEEAQRFADAIHAQFPGKMLAYNCSPSFNWQKKLSPANIASFQRDIAAMGYRFQFVTLAGFHSLNHAMFELARGYPDSISGLVGWWDAGIPSDLIDGAGAATSGFAVPVNGFRDKSGSGHDLLFLRPYQSENLFTVQPRIVGALGGPEIVSAVIEATPPGGGTARTTMLVAVSHDAGNDLIVPTGAAGGGGWNLFAGYSGPVSLTTGATNITPIACARVDPTHLRLTFASSITQSVSTLRLFHCMGLYRVGRGNVVTDNYSVVTKPAGFEIAEMGTDWSLNYSLQSSAYGVAVS